MLFVCQGQAVQVSTGCGIQDGSAESIQGQYKDVELMEGFRVSIVRKPPKRGPDAFAATSFIDKLWTESRSFSKA